MLLRYGRDSNLIEFNKRLHVHDQIEKVQQAATAARCRGIIRFKYGWSSIAIVY